MTYFRPLRIFMPIAVVLFLVGFGKLLLDFWYLNVKGTSVVLLLASLHTLSIGIVADMICFLRRHRNNNRD
jgi:hypothetical protein